MQNILFFIAGVALGFFVKDKTQKSFAPRQAEEMDEMRKEAHEALAERTEKRKEKILEFMNSEAVHQKELKACDIQGESSERAKVTCSDIERLLEVSGGTARKYLNELEDESKIKQIGERGKDVYYEIV
jgi:Fic family protein